MSALTADRFGEFFYALHGYEPFPWQTRLAERVCASRDFADTTNRAGTWPSALALPTASGKTASLDVAIFALACQAHLAPEQRSAARRIFFVVDRRIIVDEAFERVRCIARQLQTACDGILFEVANALRVVAGDLTPQADPRQSPLDCFQLRGGMYRDDAWARTPTQPTVICSTVDQVGSRLLFRSYGGSFKVWPLHAGLAANDSLILLDEAHCAKPFRQTLAAIARYRQWAKTPIPTPFAFSLLSATPGEGDDDVLPLVVDGESQPETLTRRLTASKPARLIASSPKDYEKPKKASEESPDMGDAEAEDETKQKPQSSKPRNHPEHLAQLAVGLSVAQGGNARRVVIFVNRVQTAREVFTALEQVHKIEPGHRALFIGRMRPLDRDVLTKCWQDLVGAKDKRDAPPRPLFVVSTQCLEVGANFDFDGLVTEAASLDALRQRFGRLFRLGMPPGVDPALHAPAVIVASADALKAEEGKDDKGDPIYGTALVNTWNWLRTVDENLVDFGIEALAPKLEILTDTELASLNQPAPDAPVMLPAHVDCWAQTAPVPMPSPDVSLFLHGRQRGVPTVNLCWRCDLPSQVIEDGRPLLHDKLAELWGEIVALCPPASSECAAVPLPLVKRWLRGERLDGESDRYGDLESSAAAAEVDRHPTVSRGRTPPRALRWRARKDRKDKDHALAKVDDLLPGDTLVVPAFRLPAQQSATGGAGYDCCGSDDLAYWLSGSPPDHGDAVQLSARRRALIRLHPDVLASWPSHPDSALDKARNALLNLLPQTAETQRDAIADPDWRASIRALLDDCVQPLQQAGQHWLAASAQLLSATGGVPARNVEWLVHPSGHGVIIQLRRPVSPKTMRTLGELLYDADDLGTNISDFTTEDDSASFTAVHMPLANHLSGVAEFAGRFSAPCLSASLCEDVIGAARLHDLGKLDSRFQTWLHGGNQWLAQRSEPLAKSAAPTTDARSRERARIKSNYPEGGRHELLSVRLAESAPTLLPEDSGRRDLVLHLIASHHGHCRPFAPVVIDKAPEIIDSVWSGQAIHASSDTHLERLDSGVAERFWTLVRRYGWWGLAYLEAIHILADHRRSEWEQLQEEMP